MTVESSDPSVVSVSAVQAGDSVSYYLRANKAGKAKITVASVLDPSKTASYEVEVKAGVDTSALVAALSKAAGYSESVYTKDSYAALTTAVEAARKLLDSGQGSYSKKDVADATAKIEKAIDGLKMRPVDEKILINTPENRKNVKVADFSSEADYEAATPSTLSTATSGRFGTATGPWDRYAPVSECRPGPRLRSHRRYIPAAPGRRH